MRSIESTYNAIHLIANSRMRTPCYFYVTFQNNATFVITIRAVQLMILYKICLLSRSADNPSIEFHELRYETCILSSNFDF